MTFNELYNLCINESRTFVGEYELDIEHFRKILDVNGRIIVRDTDRGKNKDFEKTILRPIMDYLESNGEKVSYYIDRHDMYPAFKYMITRIPVAEPEPEPEPWEMTKKRLEKQRISRGHPHPGKSSSIMAMKTSRQKTIGQPIDNTFGYGDKDDKGRPLYYKNNT
jgi:hypothetical protein